MFERATTNRTIQIEKALIEYVEKYGATDQAKYALSGISNGRAEYRIAAVRRNTITASLLRITKCIIRNAG